MQIGKQLLTSMFCSNICILQIFFTNWTFDFIRKVSRREDYELENVRFGWELDSVLPISSPFLKQKRQCCDTIVQRQSIPQKPVLQNDINNANNTSAGKKKKIRRNPDILSTEDRFLVISCNTLSASAVISNTYSLYTKMLTRKFRSHVPHSSTLK